MCQTTRSRFDGLLIRKLATVLRAPRALANTASELLHLQLIWLQLATLLSMLHIEQDDFWS